jgi:hypothetical protein
VEIFDPFSCLLVRVFPAPYCVCQAKLVAHSFMALFLGRSELQVPPSTVSAGLNRVGGLKSVISVFLEVLFASYVIKYV